MHDAIGTPALLPDGSISQESVMASSPGGVQQPRELGTSEENPR
jgi:hypothetical protein